MSIKQNGGVFGRNPTFNEVTTEGSVTSEGRINAEGGMTVTGGTLVVTDQTVTFQGTASAFSRLHFDPATQRVGIGLTTPARRLEVYEPSSSLVAQFRSGTASMSIALANTGSTADAVRVGSSGGTLQLSTWFTPRLSIAGGSGTTGNVVINTGDLVIDTAGKGLKHGASGPLWTAGAGSPEGAVTAPPGSLYTDTAGGAGATLYVKESGTGNTGWVAK